MSCRDFADGKRVQEASGLPQPATREIPLAESASEYILSGFDSFWKEVNERLTISRTVDYSVIGCVVNAVSQEAAELVASREAEVVGLKEDVEELLLGQQVRGEIEKVLIGNVLRSLGEEFETKLRDRNVHLRGDRRTASRIYKFEELSGLRKHWNAIRKSISGLGIGQLSSHGYLETDHSHLKSINQVSPTSGQADEFNSSSPESRESSQLRSMDIDELYHFPGDIQWDYESAMQATTEQNFSLKRVLLNERRTCLQFKKEIDLMRKKIPEAIVELDEILLEILIWENQHLRNSVATRSDEVEHLTYQLPDASKKMSQHSLDEAKLNEAIGDLESRVQDAQTEASDLRRTFLQFKKEIDLMTKKIPEAIVELDEILLEILLSENQHLRNSVASRSDEVEHLNSQLSDASKKASQHSLDEAKLNEAIGDLESRVQDAQIEASVGEGVFEGYMTELLLQIGSDVEESNAMSAVAQECMEIIYKETVHHVAAAVKTGDDSDFDSIFLQGISGIVFEEVLTGAGMELERLNAKCLQESERAESLKCNALEMERTLAKEAEENSCLRREVAALEASVEDAIEECWERNASYEEEITVLKERLESVEKERRELVVREKNNSRLAAAKDAEQRKQMESTIHYFLDEFEIFKIRAGEKITSNSLRLKKSTGQLNSLNQRARTLRQRLAKRVSDHRKAEAEVDLLGDEVETLSNLLEKIYIALDHYSPILRYYPGVMETLELIRKKLSEKSMKSI